MAKFEDFDLPSHYDVQGKENKIVLEKEDVFDSMKELSNPDFAVPTLFQLQQNLNNCLRIIDDEVLKGYITQIGDLPIVPADSAHLSQLDMVQFFRITELVYQENEFSPYKLAAVFSTLKNKPCTLSLLIKSDGQDNEVYLGVRSLDSRYSSGTMRLLLESTLLGQFPGTKIQKSTDNGIPDDLNQTNIKCISSVTGIADYKQSEEKVDDSNFIQGLEKFINGMKGRQFTAIFLAEDLSHNELAEIRREYENIYTQISPFANIQYNFANTVGSGKSQSKSKGNTTTTSEGKSESLTESSSDTNTFTTGSSKAFGKTNSYGETKSQSSGKTDAVSRAEGYTRSVANGYTNSINVGIFGGAGGIGSGLSGGLNISGGVSNSTTYTNGTSKTDTISKSISQTLSHGINTSHADSFTESENESTAHGLMKGTSSQIGSSSSVSESVNFVDSDTLSETFGNTQGVTLNAQNMALSNTLKKVEKQLERLDECESIGMWNFSAYFLGESSVEAESAAYMYQSVVMGNDSSIETSAVNTWHKPNAVETGEDHIRDDIFRNIYEYLRHFTHPKFLYQGFTYEDWREVIVDPTSRVSTNELALHMGLPRYSIKGLPVTQHAVFAQEVISLKNRTGKEEEPEIELGKIYHLGEETQTKVNLDFNSLTMHTFISGSTGSGKSNAVYHLLSKVKQNGIPFLVIEPAKGEYHKVFKNVNYYCTNPDMGDLLQLNPFAFPSGMQILEHIDRLVEIFNVCWPMYAAMPAVLKDSIERAYRAAGWDLRKSHNAVSDQLFPTFEDVLRELNSTIKESDYSDDTKGDYIGSLSTRLRSLTNGINGEIFTGSEMDLHKLFDESTIVDISRVGAMETKALIMGIIVLKLQEYRQSNATEMNSALKHITILEEAHNLLKKTSTEQSQDSANIQGKSVEMLTNTIAEIRTYGEGFVIVDQAPNLLDTAVIRNTNTKIILRLPEETDREITGKAMALNDDQISELAKLETGVGAVYQNDWQEAVLCKLPFYEPNEYYIQKESSENTEVDSDTVLHMLLKRNLSTEEKGKLKKEVIRQNVSAKIRKDIVCNLENRNSCYEWAVADFINKTHVFDNVFRGTQNGSWKNLGQLAEIATDNIRSEFPGFNRTELQQILYYICRIMHERFPEKGIIEELRENYLRWEVR